MRLKVNYIQTGFNASHKTESFDADVHLKSEYLDNAPAWCDRVVFMKYTSPRVLETVSQYDWNREEKEWDRFVRCSD